MSYYGLTTAAFCSALPELEIGYFVGMERLVIRGNQIDNYGLLDLCDCLYSSHNTTLHELDISETSVTDEGIKGLIEAMELICITVVDMEDLREVS